MELCQPSLKASYNHVFVNLFISSEIKGTTAFSLLFVFICYTYIKRALDLGDLILHSYMWAYSASIRRLWKRFTKLENNSEPLSVSSRNYVHKFQIVPWILTHVGLFRIRATLWANLQVEMVSDTFFSSADKAAIIAVLQFPPAVLREY